MNGVSQQKFLLDAIECSSIIRADIPGKLEFLKLPKENIVTFVLGFEEENCIKKFSNTDLLQTINKAMESRKIVCFTIIELGDICVVTNLSPVITDDMKLKEISLELAQMIREAIQKDLGLLVNVGVSRIFNGHNGLGMACGEASIALRDRFFKEPGSITHVDDMCGLALTETSTEIIAFIEAAEYKAARERLDRFYDYLRDNIHNDLCLYKRLSMNLLVEIYQFLLETVKDVNSEEMRNMLDVYKKMEACTTIEATYHIAEVNIKEWVSYLKRLRYKRYEVLVDRAIGYIELNYAKNVGLADVAAHIGISVGHFSSIFKQYTKKNFVQFLVEYRIERAKKLLLSPEATVYEVASLTGFNDDKYFHRIFKAHTGFTPTDYRKSAMHLEQIEYKP